MSCKGNKEYGARNNYSTAPETETNNGITSHESNGETWISQ